MVVSCIAILLDEYKNMTRVGFVIRPAVMKLVYINRRFQVDKPASSKPDKKMTTSIL